MIQSSGVRRKTKEWKWEAGRDTKYHQHLPVLVLSAWRRSHSSLPFPPNPLTSLCPLCSQFRVTAPISEVLCTGASDPTGPVSQSTYTQYAPSRLDASRFLKFWHAFMYLCLLALRSQPFPAWSILFFFFLNKPKKKKKVQRKWSQS